MARIRLDGEASGSDNHRFRLGNQVAAAVEDFGTAGSRTLNVFRTETGDAVTTVDYIGSPRIEAARYLYFDAPSTKKGPISTCKEAPKWKRQGGTVGWVQGKKLASTHRDQQTSACCGVSITSKTRLIY